MSLLLRYLAATLPEAATSASCSAAIDAENGSAAASVTVPAVCSAAVGADNGATAGSATAATGGTVTLTDPADLTLVQRVAGVGSLALAGSYTGTPSAIEARVVLHGTSTGAMAWATVDAAPAGGTFSGTLSGIPQGGWYDVEVRFGNNTAITDASTARVGVGAWILWIGQSLAARPFNSGGTVDPVDTRIVCISSTQATSDIAPKGSVMLLPDNTLGAADFANHLINTLGIPVGLVDAGVGATSVSNWDGASSTYRAAAVSAVSAVGGAIEAAIWVQGEQDIALGVSQADYVGWLATNADSVITELRGEVANASQHTSLPIYISPVGRNTSYTDAATEAIRAAQLQVIAETDDCLYAGQKADLDLVDGIHLTVAAFGLASKRYAQSMLYDLGLVGYPGRGPEIVSALLVDATTVRVTLAHRGGTDITPSTGIAGFEVLSAGTPVTVSSAARGSATTIDLSLAAPASGTMTVRYLYGADGGVTAGNTFTGEVMDNSGLTLPLEGLASMAVANASASAAIAADDGTVSAGATAVIGVSAAITADNGTAAGSVTAAIPSGLCSAAIVADNGVALGIVGQFPVPAAVYNLRAQPRTYAVYR